MPVVRLARVRCPGERSAVCYMYTATVHVLVSIKKYRAAVTTVVQPRNLEQCRASRHYQLPSLMLGCLRGTRGRCRSRAVSLRLFRLRGGARRNAMWSRRSGLLLRRRHQFVECTRGSAGMRPPRAPGRGAARCARERLRAPRFRPTLPGRM